MFRAGNVPGAGSSTLHRFLPVICDFEVVEHLMNVPLWIVQALVQPAKDIAEAGDDRLWERYLISDSEALAEMITNKHWEKFQLHVVLPNYVTEKQSPSLERCRAIWNGITFVEGHERPTWYFQTEFRGFFDVFAPEGARKTTVLWEDVRMNEHLKQLDLAD